MASQFTTSIVMASIVILIVLFLLFFPLLSNPDIRDMMAPLLVMVVLTIVNVLMVALI